MSKAVDNWRKGRRVCARYLGASQIGSASERQIARGGAPPPVPRRILSAAAHYRDSGAPAHRSMQLCEHNSILRRSRIDTIGICTSASYVVTCFHITEHTVQYYQTWKLAAFSVNLSFTYEDGVRKFMAGIVA
jgi:hypothetical protein